MGFDASFWTKMVYYQFLATNLASENLQSQRSKIPVPKDTFNVELDFNSEATSGACVGKTQMKPEIDETPLLEPSPLELPIWGYYQHSSG